MRPFRFALFLAVIASMGSTAAYLWAPFAVENSARPSFSPPVVCDGTHGAEDKDSPGRPENASPC